MSILLSSFNIRTLKSWSVLSDPFIQAGGSWTLRKFSRLFPSGVGSVEESESLLLMPSGSHSILSKYHTKKTLELKVLANIICGEKLNFNRRCVSTNSIYCKCPRVVDKKNKGTTRVKLSTKCASVGKRRQELNTESRQSDRPAFLKLHQRAQVNKNLSFESFW